MITSTSTSMRATFIGQDGSMGLKHGQEYTMKFTEYGFWKRLAFGYRFRIIVTVRRAPFDFIKIPYSRSLTFLKNWHVTQV